MIHINRSTRIGLFVFIVIGITIWGFYFLKGSNIFKNENRYFIIYDNIDGLVESSPVQIRGLRVGKVSSIHFTSQAYESLTVEISIDKNIRIPRGTIAKVYSSDLMGSKSIELVLNNKGQYFKPGDTLGADIEENIREQVKLQMLPLKKKAEDLMNSMDSVLAMVEYIFNDNTKENIRTSILKIRRTFENLEHSTSQLDTIVSKSRINVIMQNVESITSNIRQHNKDISHILANISSFSDTLAQAHISQTLNKANLALTEFEAIVNKVNRGEGTIGQLLNNDTLFHKLKLASSDLDSLLVDVKANPKRYVHFSIFGSNPNKNKKK